MTFTRSREVEESSYTGRSEPYVGNPVTIVTADAEGDCALKNFISCETSPWGQDRFMQWLGCLQRKSRQEKEVHATLGQNTLIFSEHYPLHSSLLLPRCLLSGYFFCGYRFLFILL